MPVWIGRGGADGTCEGSTVEFAMHPFSNDLYEGCKHFAHLAESFENTGDIRLANTSCILFGVSAIEAKLNESISVGAAIEADCSDTVWTEIQKSQMRSSLRDKWDRIGTDFEGALWNSGQEPFQSYELVVALRNELTHYKGTMFGKDETPNKRVAHIMRTLGVKSEASFTEDDCSCWVSDLLESRDLGRWVVNSVHPLWEKMFDLLGIHKSR